MRRQLTAATDEQLAARIAATGSEEACAELFRRYRRKIYLWCFNYCADADEAVDRTQEIFIRIFRGLEGFAGRARFSTWVYRIVRNHCVGELDRPAVRWRRGLEPLDGLEVEDVRWAEHVRRTETAGALEDVLAAAGRVMKARELEAFVLHYREGLSVREIGQLLGCTNATGARTLIQNARRKFRRIVGSGADAERKDTGDD